jgi:hypothetical protein
MSVPSELVTRLSRRGHLRPERGFATGGFQNDVAHHFRRVGKRVIRQVAGALGRTCLRVPEQTLHHI